jgi:hypothetical protein
MWTWPPPRPCRYIDALAVGTANVDNDPGGLIHGGRLFVPHQSFFMTQWPYIWGTMIETHRNGYMSQNLGFI